MMAVTAFADDLHRSLICADGMEDNIVFSSIDLRSVLYV